MKWDDFYDQYLDLDTKEAIELSKQLEEFKNPDEVFDVVLDFESVDKEYACKFLKKAYMHGVSFSPDDIYEFMYLVDKAFFKELVLNASTPYTLQNLADLFEYIDDSFVEQITLKYHLDIYSDSDMLYEMISSIVSDERERAEKYLNEANVRNVRFTSEQIIEYSGFINEVLLYKLAINASTPYTNDELEDLSCELPGFLFESFAKHVNVDARKFVDEDEEETKPQKESKLYNAFSIFAEIFGLLLMGLVFPISTEKKHSGKCEGDCASCPPHWGYRYGRRYYGHLHSSGCDFGGRKNAG